VEESILYMRIINLKIINNFYESFTYYTFEIVGMPLVPTYIKFDYIYKFDYNSIYYQNKGSHSNYNKIYFICG